uniref:Uncharacterized protein n=1 Tax=Anguilla anguilla TaxID=7936 RepID=A0A0E9RS32_ANGAN
MKPSLKCLSLSALIRGYLHPCWAIRVRITAFFMCCSPSFFKGHELLDTFT